MSTDRIGHLRSLYKISERIDELYASQNWNAIETKAEEGLNIAELCDPMDLEAEPIDYVLRFRFMLLRSLVIQRTMDWNRWGWIEHPPPPHQLETEFRYLFRRWSQGIPALDAPDNVLQNNVPLGAADAFVLLKLREFKTKLEKAANPKPPTSTTGPSQP